MTELTFPHAADLEEVVLGEIMMDTHSMSLVESIITKDTFYSSKNQAIFDCMKQLHNNGDPIDVLTVTQQVMKEYSLDYVGGAIYISELTDRVGSTANIETHAKILQEKFVLREVIKKCNEAIQKTQKNEDALELLNNLESDLRSIGDGVAPDSVSRSSIEILKEIEQEIEAAKLSDNPIVGIPSGIADLDKVLGGFKGGAVYLVAGRPGMGKSGFALDLAESAERFGKKVVFVTLEMTDKEVMKRRLTRILNTSVLEIDKGNVDFQHFHSEIGKIKDDIEIWDPPKLSIFDFRNRIRRKVMNGECDMVVVDYLGLMDGDPKYSGNTAKYIGSISRTAKQVAMENDIPVIALHQLSREVEKTPDKRPMLSHLRDSGEIEQDVDVAMFVYRPEYYGFPTFADNADTHNKAEIIIAKHRGGASNKNIRTGFDGPKTHFYCLESRNFDDTRNISESNPYNNDIKPNNDFDSLGDEIDF